MDRQAEPIFILGIMPRSGTNFLWDLLCLHPDCAPARSPVMEDFFLEASDHLIDYTTALREKWDPRWGVFDDALLSRLHRSLGDGLISFLWIDRDRRLVTKSPSVTHLGRFFRFFPDARLIILVRDGRSVAQSAMSAFGWEFDRAARGWAQAADTIRRFQARQAERAGRWHLVRYEDLLEDLEGAMTTILRFVGLDDNLYDFESASQLPVRGSSFYFGPDRGSVHWDPVEKSAAFDPKERWRSWDRARHERFEWIAGDQLRHFGYVGLAPRVDPAQALRHRVLDWRWETRSALKRWLYAARVELGTASRPLRQRLGLHRTERDPTTTHEGGDP